ncbi:MULTISPECIES: hypothetical protein [Bacillaceae]|uniref:hypothetical protein n=1 Tax=Bacillaceae TaxID=186817 RepID=UPI001BDF4CFD|nr:MULTISPECIES: hypothetical protein [Bacillaceae]MDX8361962.1 hypothetical protein [Cytobacillus sp. IB215316]
MSNRDDINLQINKELEHFSTLDDFSVEFPSEDEMYQTIDTLRQYVPERQQKSKLDKLADLLRLSTKEIFFIDKSFWITNLTFFLIGFLLTMNTSGNPYFAIMLLSPVPFLLGLLEVFKGRDRNFLELELTCKYNAQQLMLSKMVVTGVYNFILMVFLITLLSFTGDGQMLLTKVLMYWILPFTLVASFGLLLASKLKGQIAAPLTVILWISFVGIYMSNEQLITYMESRPVIFYIIAFLLAVTFFIFQIKKITRGVSLEFNN